MIKFLEKMGFYDFCGCDACRWEAYNFYFFYWFKDWDKENPKWKFGWRNK